MHSRIVLAYSGDVKTSVAVSWLAEHYRSEVVTVTLDLGQGGNLSHVRDRALAAGAARAHVVDSRDELARHYVLPSLQANVPCPDVASMASAPARPLIAKTLVEVARMEDARSVAHGSTASGGAIERLVHSLDPDLRVVAPARAWGMTEQEAAEYARQRRIPVPAGGPDHRALPRPAAVPYVPAIVELAFEQGVPVAINGVPMPLTELIESLTLIAGQHGVGRPGSTTHLPDGGTAGGCGEAPAAHVLRIAHAVVAASVLPPDVTTLGSALSQTYAQLVDNGRWFTPLREAIGAFQANVESRVTGSSRLRLFRGEMHVMPHGAAGPGALAEAELAGRA